MKKIFKLTLALAMVFSTTTVFAQKLARVNTQEIFAIMPDTKQMEENLNAFGQELQAQLEALQVEFNNLYADYEKNQANWNPTVRQMKQAELNDKQRRYAENQQIAQQDYAKKQQEEAQPIQEKLDAAIAKVAKAGGYAAVFDTMAFVYYDEA